MASFQVRLDDEARRNIDSIYCWIAQHSTDGANRWYLALLEALDELVENAHQYPEAPESQLFPESYVSLREAQRPKDL